jgi:Asp-tRNA(Asn)/Glu-tRNA(Gln) amidotransferase A subunit family amidase
MGEVIRTGRRAFLKQVPAAAAGLAVPVALANAEPGIPTPPVAAEQGAATGEITTQTLAAAQQVAGLNLPAGELDAVRPLVQRNLANIEAMRQVALPSELEPAFAFRPPRPPRSPREPVETAGPPRPTQPPRTPREMTLRPRPANLEDLAFESVAMLGARLRAKQITSTELTKMYLARLTRADPTLFCVVTFTEELALEQAAAADQMFSLGRDLGPLHGIPYGIKDLFATKDIPTTWGAKPYANQVFDYDATAVVRMREAGAVLIAKLTTGELAVGDLWFKARTRNPWNPERGSSGSSAGPASATSAGLVGFSIGTETGGSIISPASTCGVVGLRPTYGRSSRFGAMTLRWTLDKVGALARTVEDTAFVLEALHGPDGRDETVADLPFTWSAGASVRRMRIGYLEGEFASASVTTKPIYDAALEVYRNAGATLVPVAMPDLPASAMYAILNAEAGAMFDELVRTGAINEMADKGVNGRANQLRAARFIPAVDYIRAQRVRTLLVQQVSAMFTGPDKIDAFLSPSSSESVAACNLTGHPAITIPAGFVGGLPVGLMVTGPLFDEGRILDVAGAFESATDWHTRHPT